MNLVVLEKHTDGFSMVNATDRFSEDTADVQDLKLGTQFLVLLLWHAVRDDDLVDRRSIDAGNRIAAEDAVGEKRVDVCGALAFHKLGGAGNCVGGVCEIVNEDGDTAGYVSYEHHRRILAIGDAGRSAFLQVWLVVASVRRQIILPYESKRSPYSNYRRLL